MWGSVVVCQLSIFIFWGGCGVVVVLCGKWKVEVFEDSAHGPADAPWVLRLRKYPSA